MKILGIDFGSKRIGVAVSDELKSMAHPVGTLSAQPRALLLERLKVIIVENQVSEIVVGLPVNMNGTQGPQVHQTLEFVAWLESHFDVPVCTWDERLTTVQGDKFLVGLDLSRKQRRRVVDSFCARLLLQEYLDRIGEQQNR